MLKENLIGLKNIILGNYRKYRKLWQFVLIPLLSSPLIIAGQSQVANCAFVILVMSIYWITECIPIPITSILPVFLFPVFGIMKTKVVSTIYFHENIMFIFASLIIGLGIESTGLHKKIALRVCMFVGSEPKWLLLGIMSATGFLSVWISNTATSSMILPIVVSIVKQLVKLDPVFKGKDDDISMTEIKVTTIPMDTSESQANLQDLKNKEIEEEENLKKKDEKSGEVRDFNAVNEEEELEERDHDDTNVFKTKEAKNLIKCFCLSITYASTIGGTGSLIGTSSNIVFKGYFETSHPNDALNFLTFMLYSLPISIILLVVCWITLCLIWLPKGKFLNIKNLFSKSKDGEESPDMVKILIKKKYEALGPYTWGQISIGTWFVIVVILWLTRDLYFVPGWGALFPKEYNKETNSYVSYVSDTTSAVFILILAITWPKENIFRGAAYEPLLTWREIEKMFPWTIIFLIGGSLAMAEGCEKSGLSLWFGNFLKDLLPTSKIPAYLVITTFSVIGTEFISNISMVSILLPILDMLSTTNHISYYYVLLPQAIAVNFSYMLPAAAPSNAIVFAGGHLTLKDMITTGLILKVLAFIVLFIASNTWLELIFLPPLDISNSTVISNFTTTVENLVFGTTLNF